MNGKIDDMISEHVEPVDFIIQAKVRYPIYLDFRPS